MKHGRPDDPFEIPRTPKKSFFPAGDDDEKNEQARRRLVALSVDAGVPGRVADIEPGPRTGA